MDMQQGRPSVYAPSREQFDFQVFLAEVLTIDVDRKVCTILDLRNQIPYQGVDIFPANSSSHEATDVDMPEQGSRCIATHVNATAGFFEVAIISWVVSDTNRAQQGIATRAIDIETMEGWNRRKRGSYRKAYPGQKTKTTSEGFSEKQDDGWDKLAADFSRDRLDPLSRTWTTTTSRRIGYTDSGISIDGPVHRPGAANLKAELLPDGQSRYVAYLQPGATASNRYQQGESDVIPIVERTTKVQEFALDFPIPAEVLGTSLLDQILGVTADLWGRTTVEKSGSVAYDDQAFMIDQTWDHPYYTGTKPVGPTLAEGPTPRRRGYILEHTEGTLVGSNLFDVSTYGQVLKPLVFPYTKSGRFGSDVESGYLPVVSSTDHVETRLAASAYSTRFTHEANTTRWDVTKEGMLLFEIGSSIPKENIPLAGDYEHPHGAGRSIEGHTVGSLKLVVGKNRDEEDAIDLQALGQMVLRIGADDTSLPNQRRSVMTQVRGQSDAVQSRELQFWKQSKLTPGDAGNLAAKVGGESVSLRGALDGGAVMRFGARHPNALRRHLMNGYSDGPGIQPWSLSDASRQDSKSPGRPTYGAGDSVYAFHDLTQVGKPHLNLLPYYWSGSPVTNMDEHGLSIDFHTVRDILLRAGKNEASGQSMLLDLAGGIVAAVGQDNQGRSITASLDGGVELTIGPSKAGKALRIEFRGDLDWTVMGNFHLNVTGDYVVDSTSYQQIAKTNIITRAQNQTHVAMVQHTTEAPSVLHNQGMLAAAGVAASEVPE